MEKRQRITKCFIIPGWACAWGQKWPSYTYHNLKVNARRCSREEEIETMSLSWQIFWYQLSLTQALMWKIRRLITQQNASALDTTPVDDPMLEIIQQTISSHISRLTARCDLQRRGWAEGGGGGGGWGFSRPSSDNNTMEKDSERKKKIRMKRWKGRWRGK